MAFWCQLRLSINQHNMRESFIVTKQVMQLTLSTIIILLLSCITTTTYAKPFIYPESITLRAGVIHATPFASVNDDGTFSGLQIDLIESIKIFAANDGVELNVLLQAAPAQYTTSFDLVANDCTNDCDRFDFIVGNYYTTPARSIRADLSPAWLQSTISAIRYADYRGPEILTLAQASRAGATVCVKQGAFYATLVIQRYPGAEYVFCASFNDCVDQLKDQKCVLYPDDELPLRYLFVNDPTIEMTGERFNTQYIAWPINFNVDPTASLLLKRWIYQAINNGTLDALHFNYFERQQCPYGTAGKNCELFCHPDHGRSNLDGICVCESIKWTGVDCSVEVEEDWNLIPTQLKSVGYSMFGINVAVVIACAIWLCIKRETSQVHVSQPSFLLLVLLGCLISSSTILALAHEDNVTGTTSNACMAIPWTYSIGFSITFGSLFAKIRRVHIIFKSAAQMRHAAVTIRETLLIIGVVLLIDLAVLITWTVVDPLQWQREVIMTDKFGEPMSSVGYCSSYHWKFFSASIAVLHFSLLAMACYLCYVTRNISTKFSQGKHVAIAMVSNMQIFLVGVPVLVIVGSDSDTAFFVRCIIIWMNDLMVVLIIFGNLMYSVSTEPVLTVSETIQSATRDYLSSNRSLCRGDSRISQRSSTANISSLRSSGTVRSSSRAAAALMSASASAAPVNTPSLPHPQHRDSINMPRNKRLFRVPSAEELHADYSSMINRPNKKTLLSRVAEETPTTTSIMTD